MQYPYTYQQFQKERRAKLSEQKKTSHNPVSEEGKRVVIDLPDIIEIPALGISLETKSVMDLLAQLISKYLVQRVLEQPNILSEAFGEEWQSVVASLISEQQTTQAAEEMEVDEAEEE